MQNDAGFRDALISVRIVHIDHYQLPLSEYSNSVSFQAAWHRLTCTTATKSSARLPVIRIYGATPSGQKCCLHLHGLLPYMYVPLPSSHSLSAQAAVSLSERLRSALEVILNNSFHQSARPSTTTPAVPPASAPTSVSTASSQPHIARVTPELKRSIYGYSRHESMFLRIETYNPMTIPRIASVLYQGGLPEELSSLKLQPYESHIPFSLQAMTDLGLVGMGYINLSTCRFRHPLPDCVQGETPASAFEASNLQRLFKNGLQKTHPRLFWPFQMPRRAKSELELDAFVEDVLNARKSMPATKTSQGTPHITHSFVSKTLRILWEEERLRTGVMPMPKEEALRNVMSGAECTEDYYKAKLHALAAGLPVESPATDIASAERPAVPAVSTQQRTQEGEESQEKPPLSAIPSSYEDIFQYLDGAASVNDASVNLDDVNVHATVDSDGEIELPEDAGDEDVASAWADIAECTQEQHEEESQEVSEIHPIPQGDGNNESPDKDISREEKRDNQSSSRSKKRRRRKRAMSYNFLEVQDAPALTRSRPASSVSRQVELKDDNAQSVHRSGEDEMKTSAPPSHVKSRLSFDGHSKSASRPLSDDESEHEIRPISASEIASREAHRDNSIRIKIAGNSQSSTQSRAELASFRRRPRISRPEIHIQSPQVIRSNRDRLSSQRSNALISPFQPSSAPEAPSLDKDAVQQAGQMHSETNPPQSEQRISKSRRLSIQKPPEIEPAPLKSAPQDASAVGLSALSKAPTVIVPESPVKDAFKKSEVKIHSKPPTGARESPRVSQENANSKVTVHVAASPSAPSSRVGQPTIKVGTEIILPKSNTPTPGCTPSQRTPVRNSTDSAADSPFSSKEVQLPDSALKESTPKGSPETARVRSILKSAQTTPTSSKIKKSPSPAGLRKSIGFNLASPKTPVSSPRHAYQKIASPQGSKSISPATESTPQADVVRADIFAACFRPKCRPPLLSRLRETDEERIPSVVHQPAYYGNPLDAPAKAQVFAGKMFRIPIGGIENMKPFPSLFVDEFVENLGPVTLMAPIKRPPRLRDLYLPFVSEKGAGKGLSGEKTQKVVIDSAGRQVRLEKEGRNGLESTEQTQESFQLLPIDGEELKRRAVGMGDEDVASDSDSGSDIIEDITISRRMGAQSTTAKPGTVVQRPSSPKYDERSFFQDIVSSQDFAKSSCHSSRMEAPTKSPSSSLHASQNLTVMAIEILASCYGQKLPDPSHNPILAIHTIVRDERQTGSRQDVHRLFRTTEISGQKPHCGSIVFCESETGIFDSFAKHINDTDPDILTGFEIQSASVGYILERSVAINHPFSRLVARDLEKDKGMLNLEKMFGIGGGTGAESAAAAYFRRKGANIAVKGRHVLNLWRVVRSEVKLASYSAEGVAFELLKTSIPKHSSKELEAWLSSPHYASRSFAYLQQRTELCIAIIDKLDVLGRTGELARVFGVDFMSVLTRGSQYRVESMMARVAHERDFLLLAAQKEQVYAQPAVESLPLVMEPVSNLYVDPVIVLDFQSLYPSMIIAHNLCFSTMMGNINRIHTWEQPRPLGVVPNYVASDISAFGKDALEKFFVAPNGELFVTAKERVGILPQMLDEILKTRIMVKGCLKEVKDDEKTARLLNARQFGLKMIANVTYGYTSASFSGRMPCANLADAIVQCGRDALERIVRYVDEELNETTGANVAYGDTDSLFVRVPGATRKEAFQVGEKIVQKALEMFPVPVRLQLEKVYHPCVLLTKKRYVGYSYESADQEVPIFDAKGIETVRRDSCALVQNTLEQAIRILFETRDISRVKRSVQRVWQRVITNRLPLSLYIFRKEVRLGSYKPGHLPPAAIVATKAMEVDPRAAPRYGERVPFVVIYEGPGTALKNSVVTPEELLQAEADGTGRLNATYYITKQIMPALDRVFSLIGVRVATWYAEMPRPSYPALVTRNGAARRGIKLAGRNSLYRYYASEQCAVCKQKATKGRRVCDNCISNEDHKRDAIMMLAVRARNFEKKYGNFLKVCAVCIGLPGVDGRDARCVNLDCAVLFNKHTTALQMNNCREVLLDEHLQDEQIF